jgi:hypothetical protein
MGGPPRAEKHGTQITSFFCVLFHNVYPGGLALFTYENYCREAQACLQEAETASDRRQRVMLLELAGRWIDLAEIARRAPVRILGRMN